ncbi:hypothetical protein [Rubrivirga sp. IMCC43871]|uniref:hypothetical protein n=1 Tax=Rubrivirga sp. IMCC43871 TaxID=3391575 RepID=UPI00399037A8
MPDAAFDATADALTRRALDALPPDRPRTRADVARLAAPVAHILDARLDDASRVPASPFVDPDDPALRAASEAWRTAARAAARFPADTWEPAVARATVLALAHLVRPAETLASTAFEDAHAALPAAEVLHRLHAFGPYPYLPEIAERYVERKALDTIDRAGLEQLLRRIDRRMVSAFGPAEWATLLGPLFELSGPVGTPTGTVPAALLRDLFEAKGSPALAAVFADLDAVDPPTLRERLSATLAPRPAPRIATAPPDLTPPPLPPVAPGVAPPVVGSKYAAPEFDPVDSEVLGPPRPAGSSATPETTDTPLTDPPAEAPGAVAPDAVEMGAVEMEPSETDTAGMDAVREALAEPAPELPDEAPPPALERPAVDGPALVFPTPGDDDDTADDPVVPLAHESAPPAEEPPQFTPDPLFEDDDTDPFRPSDPYLAPELLDAPPQSSAAEPPPAPDTPAAEPTDDEPLWKRLARERGVEPEPRPTVDEDEPIWRRFARSDLAAKLPDPPAAPSPTAGADLGPTSELDALETRVLGADARDRRDRYVADLFDGSPAAYHRTLDQIDRATGYTEATSIFSAEVLRRHRVNPYTESAVAFIDAVQERFDRRK